MNKLNGLKNKLQTALYMEGAPVVLHERKFYSMKYNGVRTKYRVEVTDKETGKKQTTLSTYSLAEVVQHLAVIYREVREDAG